MWFTSDQHFGHRNIIQYCKRPFADQEEMHRELIARHNTVVSETEEVFHLGDFALDERLIPGILSQLNGRHTLVVGNHDRCHPCHSRSDAAKRRYLLYGFSSVSTEIRMGPWTVNHLPYSETRRYPEWRPVDDGGWLLHGHVHELWKTKDRMINVGVDQWNYTPVHISELERIRDELP